LSDLAHIPADRELSDRVTWLIKLRWAWLVAAVVIIVVANLWLGGALPLAALWVTLSLVMLYNLIFSLIAYRLVGPSSPYEVYARLINLQIILDLVALTAVLHFTGGLENPFSAFYVILVVAGSILMTKRDSYIYAAIATLLWVGLLLLEAYGILPHHNLTGFRLPYRYQEPIHVVSESVVLFGVNFAAAYFSSGVVSQLRASERLFYESNAACELRAGELARLNARLRELDHTRTLFIRLVTHELRAPVAAIQSYLRLILDGYVPAARFTEIITKAEQRAREQLDLIADLLDLARITEPREEDRPRPVDVAAVLHDVVDLMQPHADDKGLTLTCDIAEQPLQVLATGDHVRQVWTNLISNAIKYTPDKGQVAVLLKREDDMVRGEVRDTGIGMKPEDIEHIFENFYRAEAAKAMAQHSTGLGLSIVKGIMDRYHGRVWVESQVGVGSTFYFELPSAS
jgi:signal transduction histidine kinase